LYNSTVVHRWVPVAVFLLAGAMLRADGQATPESRDRRGVELAQAGQFDAAIAEFRGALELRADFPEAHYHLALAYEQQGHTEEAVEEYRRAIQLRPDFTQARYLLASCCRKLGDFDGELALLSAVTSAAPDFAEAHYNYGLALEAREKPVEAIAQFRAAVRLEPRNPRAALALGTTLAQQDDPQAVEALRRAVELAPGDAESHYNLALGLAMSGRDRDAIPEFHAALKLNPKHASAHRGLGIALMHEGDLAASAAELRLALDLAPNDAEAANNLGMVQLRQHDVEGAIGSLERAIRIQPPLIKAHQNLAQAYGKAGRTADSRREAERASALTLEQRNLGRAMVLVQSAGQRLAAGDAAAAVAQLREAVSLSPAFVEAQVQLGRAMRDSGGEAAEVLKIFRSALNRAPERADIHYEIALMLLRAGRPLEAAAELKASAAMAPCHAETHRLLARMAAEARDWYEAASHWRAVLAVLPGDREARNGLERAAAQ
jgi:tetratricopeptide (TPR) repeat protein